MARADLLALTPDDLAALTNRGTVKRAQRELESGEATFTLNETGAGEVTVEWSDESRCVLPAGKTVAEGRCNCPATTLCRHVVRSILAYQKHASAAAAGAGTAAGTDGASAAGPPAPPQAWDPGTITDEQLTAAFRKPALSAAQARFQQGLLIELVRSSKPTARFHQLACSLRFVVPGDVRYTHCDCAEAAPCSHVPLAVWAFRQLPADKPAGIVSTQQDDLPVPADLLDAGESLLTQLAEEGLAGLSPNWKDRAIRLESALTDAELIWPAQVIADIVQQCERYATHDARFTPQRVAELTGEFLIRADAIRGRTRVVPQLLIRGSSADRPTEIGSARYVGLGCAARQDRGGVTIAAYLQDTDSGSLVAVAREFANPPKDSKDTPKDFHQLAATPVLRGISLSAIGAGQVLLQGGKRAADHQLVVGRAKASVNPQNYVWESLRAPVLAEDFAELRARLGSLPPASLRPRYVAENLHVVPISSVAGHRFDEATQSIEMMVLDARNETALVHHPYEWRGREGCEAVLAMLGDSSRRLRFIAGQVHPSAGGLVIYPITLVFEGGTSRVGIQPWIERHRKPDAVAPGAAVVEHRHGAEAAAGHAPDYIGQLLANLGELFLTGLRRSDARVSKSWRELARHGGALGYNRLARPVTSLANELARKLHTPTWNATDAATRVVMQIAVTAKLAADLKELT
jgi:hypothetical protein